MIELLISGLSLIGGGVLMKGGVVVGKSLLARLDRKRKKWKLEKELSLSIDKLDYNKFVDTIYLIKQYDFTYKKELYNKSKNQYKYNDITLEKKEYFLRRFDMEFNINKKMIEHIVQREIERSISRLNYNIEDIIKNK